MLWLPPPGGEGWGGGEERWYQLPSPLLNPMLRTDYRLRSVATGDRARCSHQGEGTSEVRIKSLYFANSKIASISTDIPAGSDAVPTALRAAIPHSSPNTSRISSLNPLITAG